MKESLNDFVKINDKKVVFMYMYFNELVILIIDTFQLSEELLVLDFSIDLDNYTPSTIRGFAYNDYLLFSATGKVENDYYYNNGDFNNYLSIFMVFGYANGTDSIIDITKFLNKDAYDSKENFIHFLYNNLTIENNIFRYIPLAEIK